MFIKMDEEFVASGNGKPDHSAADSPESQLLGQQVSQVPELVKRASPASYISKNDPPFFIEHGTKDQLVPTEQSQQFYRELVEALGADKVTLTLLNGEGHGGPQFNSPENLHKVFTFLNKYLK